MTADVTLGNAAGSNSAAFRATRLLWVAAGGATVVFAVLLAILSRDFSPDINMADRPIIILVAFLVAGNAVAAISLPWLVYRSAALTDDQSRVVLLLLLLAGLIARLALFSSQPILENDYQRYLWDGGVTAHGYNPYRLPPAAVGREGETGALASIAQEGNATLRRIGHKELTTIYPPVAQGAFAIAHLMEPWSLNAWRMVLLIGDIATLMLLMKLLDGVGRTRLWAALYWLNPLVLKEAFNSGHMEPILLPLMLGSLFLVWRRRDGLASVALAFAAGVKLWPVILTPLLFRVFRHEKLKLVVPVTILGTAMTLWVVPMIVSSPVGSSGLIAYADSWKTNSALYPALEVSIAALLPEAASKNIPAGIISRVLLGATLTVVAVGAAWRSWRTLDELSLKTSTVIAALVLLSPAQYPWYALWFSPFFVFNPSPAFRILMTTVPLYYASFYFAAQDQPEIFSSYVVWMIWVPVWLAVAWELRRSHQAASPN